MRVDDVTEVVATGAVVGASLLTVVTTLALTLSVGFTVDTSEVALSGTAEGTTEGNWLVEVDPNSFSSVGVMSPDTGATNAA